MPVDPADDGLAELVHLHEKLGESVPAVMELQRRLLASETRQIRAGAERPITRTGKYHNRNRGFVLAPIER